MHFTDKKLSGYTAVFKRCVFPCLDQKKNVDFAINQYVTATVLKSL